jgi:hypothetical protein
MSPVDRNGRAVKVGSRVRIVRLADSLLKSLPGAEVKDLSSMIGEVFEVTEIDQYGHPWVGKGWHSADGEEYRQHAIALEAAEMELVDTEAAVREARPADAAGAKACVAAAFECYVQRIGKTPRPMLLDFAEEIAAGRVWLAELRGEVAGVLVQYETDEGFYLDTVAVQPRLHGRLRLECAEREALRRGFDSIYLCTNASMTENRALYPRIGYVQYDRQVEEGYDRVYFRKRLPQ